MTHSAKFKTILGITLFKFTHSEIAKLLQLQRSTKNFYDKLPTYTVSDRGFVRYSEEYLQWVDGKDKSSYLFNVEYADPMLQHSIDNAGLQDLLEKIDITPILKNFEPHTFEDFGRAIPVVNHIVMEVEYVEYRGYESTEYDEFVHLKGYLDKDMTFHSFTPCESKTTSVA